MARIYIAPQILSANAFDPLSATIKAPIRTIMDPAAEKIPFRPLLAGIISVTILVAIDGNYALQADGDEGFEKSFSYL